MQNALSKFSNFAKSDFAAKAEFGTKCKRIFSLSLSLAVKRFKNLEAKIKFNRQAAALKS